MAFGAFSRHWTVWKAAWQAERGASLGSVPRGRATEFLPAVLEIQQAPPSPIGRAILWTILAVFTSGVLWATFGWIDIVATAQGKIIPSGYSKTIQPYETGVIAAIHVQDGQTVKKGDVLIDLDPTLNRADRDRAVNEHQAARVEAARLQSLIAGKDTFDAPEDVDQSSVRLQQQLLLDQLAEYRAKVAAAQHLVDQRKAALGQTQENILRLEATVPMETERAAAYKRLLEHEAVTKMDFLQAEGQRIDKTQELAGQKKKLQQDRSALAEAETHLHAMLSEFQQTKQAELSTLETKAASLAQDVTKAGQKTDLQRLTTPIDGVVQQLAVHTVGGGCDTGPTVAHCCVTGASGGGGGAGREQRCGVRQRGADGRNQGRNLPVHALWDDPRPSPDGIRRRSLHRKSGVGVSDQSQHGSRDDTGRGEAGPSHARHGGDGGDQDRQAPCARVSLEPAPQVRQGKSQGAVIGW